MDAAKPRQRGRRSGWAAQVKVALNDRDRDILYLIGRCGVVRTRDLARFFFGSRATASDRLRKLYCAGLVEAFVPSLAGDNHYALTALGREQALAAFDAPEGGLRVVRKLPRKLDHALAITEVRLSVALACRDHPRYSLASFQTDADLAGERHASLLELIPDAVVKVDDRATGGDHAFFVEADLGSEAVTWLVRHKLAVYDRYAQLGTALYGVANPLVILVTPGLRRARNVARALDAARIRPRVVYALRPNLHEGNVLGDAYALGDDLLAPAGDDARAVFTRRLLP